MNKNRIRLTESQLHKVIKESVNHILNEGKYVNNRPLQQYKNDVKTKYMDSFENFAKKSNRVYLEDMIDELMDEPTERNKERLLNLIYRSQIYTKDEINRTADNFTKDDFQDADAKQQKRHDDRIKMNNAHRRSGSTDLALYKCGEESDDAAKFWDRYSGRPQIHHKNPNIRNKPVSYYDDEPEDWYERNEHGDFDEH